MAEGTERHVVLIVGGAVAGTEAAAQFTARGVRCVMLEHRQRPYGKIEEGLPRWYAKLRESERAVRPQHAPGAGHHARRPADLGPQRHRAGQRRMARALALALSKGVTQDAVLALARENAAVRRALYLCVSGEETYRNIARGALRKDAILPGIGAVLRPLLGRRYHGSPPAGQPGAQPPDRLP